MSSIVQPSAVQILTSTSLETTAPSLPIFVMVAMLTPAASANSFFFISRSISSLICLNWPDRLHYTHACTVHASLCQSVLLSVLTGLERRRRGGLEKKEDGHQTRVRGRELCVPGGGTHDQSRQQDGQQRHVQWNWRIGHDLRKPDRKWSYGESGRGLEISSGLKRPC